jgi:hypothetical protein
VSFEREFLRLVTATTPFITIFGDNSVKEIRSVFGILVGIHSGQQPLKRVRRIWKENIKLDLREVDCEGAHQNLVC